MPLVAVGRPRRVQWVGPPLTIAVGRVRRDLPRVLARWRVRADVIDEVAVVVADLLDNLVRHARSGFCVLVELDEHRLYVAVQGNPAAAAPLPGPQTRVARSGLRLVSR